MASLTAAEIRKRFDDAEDPNTVEVPAAPSPGAKIRDLFPTAAEPAAAPAEPPPPTLADVLSSPDALQADIPQSQAPAKVPFPTTIAAARSLLEPPEGFNTSSTIPFMPAVRTTQTPGHPMNDIRLDIGAFRPILQGGLDLMEMGQGLVMGPHGFDLTPEAKGTLGLVAGAGGRDLRFGPRAPLPPSIVAREAPLSPEFKAAPFAPNMLDQQALAADIMNPPGSRPVAPTSPTGIPAPPAAEPLPPPAPAPPPVLGTPSGNAALSSAGAMGTPVSALPAQTRSEFLKGLQSAVEQTAEDRAGPSLRDDTPYVPNIPERIKPQRDFSDSQHAIDHKSFLADDAKYKNDVDANKRARNDGMVDLLRKDSGDVLSLEQAHEHRSEVSPHAMGVFEGEKPVDITDFAATVKAETGSKRKAVRGIIDDVYKSLFDKDGNLETTPSVLYDVRKNITDYLKKGVKGIGEEADNVRAAKAILEKFLDPLDKKITSGATKFQDYLSQWHERSAEIDRQEFLQQYHVGGKKITDKDGYLIPNKVQKMVEDIYQLSKASGVNKAKALTPEQISNIVAVRNELSTEQLAARRGSFPGSPTVQLLQNAGKLGSGPVGGMLKSGGVAAAHLLSLGGLTKAYEIYGRPLAEARRARQDAVIIAARKRDLLSGATTDQAGNKLTPPP